MDIATLAKMAADKAESIVNTDSTGGRLADYLAPGTWGGERAGRTQAMADAIDEDTTFNVRHPVTSSLGSTVLNGLAGAGMGGGIGMGIDRLNSNLSGKGTQIGALAGGALGALNGLLASGADRREEMRRINHFYEEDRKANRLKDVKPQFSAASMLLAPGRGAHRTGQLEAKRAIGGEKSISDQHGGLRDLLYALRMVPGAQQLGLAHAYGQNARTQLASSGALDPAEDKEPKRRPKTVEKLAGLLMKSLKEPNVVEVNTTDRGFTPVAEHYREPRLLAKPFYNQRREFQNALGLLATLQPEMMQRERPNSDDAAQFGIALASRYPDRYRLPAAAQAEPDGPESKKKPPGEKSARCWEGYEPVPGKAPYSNDSCRPKGSAKKKTDEKQAECGCGCDKEEECSCSPVEKLAFMAAKHASGAWNC